MTYVTVGNKKFLLNPTSFGEDFEVLFNQTAVSINELWQAYSHNNFSNTFARTNDVFSREGECNSFLSKLLGKGWWGVVTRDKIVTGGKYEKEKLKVTYISHAGTNEEKRYNLLAPPDGYYVPNKDCPPKHGEWNPFYPDTGIPFEILEGRGEAVRRYEQYGMEPEHIGHWNISYLGMKKHHDIERRVGRLFGPLPSLYGRFNVYVNAHKDGTETVKAAEIGTFPAIE